jgi:hypothetical protein
MVLAGAVLTAVLHTNAAQAEGVSNAHMRDTVALMAGEPGWINPVAGLARGLNHRNGLRVMPVAGDGSVQALHDLALRDHVDAALIPADTLTYAEGMGLVSAGSRPAYVRSAGQLPILLVTRTDISTITGLAGKRISTGPAQSAAFATGEVLFGALGIPFTRVARANELALEALASGEADAALLVGRGQGLDRIDPKQFHVLGLPVPAGLEGLYQPVAFDTTIAGPLSAAGSDPETLSVPLMLAIADWPRGDSHLPLLGRFAQALGQQLSKTPLDDIVLAGEDLSQVAGWTRHSIATALAPENKAAGNGAPSSTLSATAQTGGQP